MQYMYKTYGCLTTTVTRLTNGVLTIFVVEKDLLAKTSIMDNHLSPYRGPSESFHNEGYLIIQNLLTQEEVVAFVTMKPKATGRNRPAYSIRSRHPVGSPRSPPAHRDIVRQLCGPIPRIVQTI